MKNLLAYATAEVQSLPDADQTRLAETMLGEAKCVAVQEGIKAADKGRTVSHDSVESWLKSWGTDNESSPPQCK